jgi:hypothetical protein
MLKPLIYAPEPDALKARDRAFSLNEVKLATKDPASTLRWMLTATDVGYSPYVMKIYSLSGLNDTKARMSFIDCYTGEEHGDPFEVDLTDRSLVWPHLPSTLDGWKQGDTDCAFVFFSSKLHGMTQFIGDTGGGEGKWPRGASLLTLHEQICSIVREHFLSEDAANTNLDPIKREHLRRLVGRLR